jgi:hypothetical protein
MEERGWGEFEDAMLLALDMEEGAIKLRNAGSF